MSLWEALPSVAVVGGQVLIIHLSPPLFYIIVFFSELICFCGKSQSSGKSSVLESVVGRDFLPRGSGNSSFTFFSTFKPLEEL